MTVWIGLTGGIGSGKSQAAAEFSFLGVPVLDADAVSRELTAEQGRALPAVRQAFGDKVFDGDTLDRAALRETVFADAAAKKRLEDILLPLIFDEIRREQRQYADQGYGIIEIPLLAEQAGFQTLVRRVLLIETDEPVRIGRVMRRSGLSEDEVKRIIAAQAGEKQRRRLADDIVINNGSTQELRQKIGRLNAYFRARFHHQPQTSK